jgi:tRNA (mo5U34)-methyltransferase
MATRDKEMTRRVKRQHQVQLGPVNVGVALGPGQAEMLRNSLPYKYVIKPALDRINGRNGHARNGAPSYRAGFPAEKPHAPVNEPASPEAQAIIDKISGYDWYHTIRLPHGVVTPGYVDHREQLPYYNLPNDMAGMRVLDVATFDGFWAFEFERRGAEVVAIDIASTSDLDIPRNWRDVFDEKGVKLAKGEGFRIASEILQSKVRKEVCSVYDVNPDRFGMFDMVFCSDLLIHLRDPLHAMESIWTVVRDRAIFADVYHPDLEAFKDSALVEFCQAGQTDVWWRPSTTCYKLWLHLARFSRVEEQSRFVLESNFRSEIPKVVFHAFR